MLGTVDRSRIGTLLSALAAGDGAALLAEIASLAEFSPDWNGVLDAFADALHRVQVKQLVPTVEIEADGIDVDALRASTARRTRAAVVPDGAEWHVATCRSHRARARDSR